MVTEAYHADKCRSSSKFRQCYYCKSDYKPKQNENLCHKCTSQEKNYGKPHRCEICQLKNAFNGVLCLRCSHYKSKFGEAVKCQLCHIEAAFVKDQASRDKVNGQILCWLCTYKYKKENLATYKSNKAGDASKSRDASKRKRDSHGGDTASASTAGVKHDPLLNPLLKRTRADDAGLTDSSSALAGMPGESMDNPAALFHRFIPSNDQLEVNHKLQEENKYLRRQLQEKEEMLISKERALTEIKAEMLEMKTSFLEKCRQMEAMSASDIDREKEKVRELQRQKSIMEKNMRQKLGRKKSAKESGSDNNSPSSFFL